MSGNILGFIVRLNKILLIIPCLYYCELGKYQKMMTGIFYDTKFAGVSF